MKNSYRILLIILASFCMVGCDSLLSQTPEEDTTKLWPAGNSSGEYIGYINAKGKMSIPAQYKRAYRFSGGKAKVVLSNDQNSFIDKHGNILHTLPTDSYCDDYFYYGCCCFCQQGRWGMFDAEFNTIIPAEYSLLGQMTREGLIRFQSPANNWRYGYMNKSGKVVIEPQFFYAADFCDGIAVVVRYNNDNMLYGAINMKGELILDTIYYCLESVGGDRLVYRARDGLYGLMDTKGGIISEPFFCTHWFYGDDELMPVSLPNDIDKFGYIDRNGVLQIPCQYDVATPFCHGEAWVSTLRDDNGNFLYSDSHSELINTRGEELLRMESKQPLAGFHNGLCPVAEGESSQWQYINKKGKVIYSWAQRPLGDHSWYPHAPSGKVALENEECKYVSFQNLVLSMFEGTEYYHLALQSCTYNR